MMETGDFSASQSEHALSLEDSTVSPTLSPAPAAVPYHSQTPRHSVGRYEIIYPIASGGMASVYVGRLSGMAGFERLFALKVIHPHLAAERSFINMFLDEARLAGRIHHPNVAEIFEVGEENGLYFMVGELVPGRDLKMLAKRAQEKKRKIKRPLIAHILAEIAFGLNEAHEVRDEDGEPIGLVHRDVSTRNILVSYKGYAKLIDFGVAWAKGRLGHTRDGSQKGKVGYMPPEQLLGKPVDRRADIYALGVVLYTMVVGTHPFPYDNEGEQIVNMLSGNFRPPRQEDPEIEAQIETIILKAMSTDPNDRYETAEEMGKALAAFADAHIEGDADSEIASLMQELFKEDIAAHDEEISKSRKKKAPRAALNAPVSNDAGIKTGSVPSRVTEVVSPDKASTEALLGLSAKTPLMSTRGKIAWAASAALILFLAGTVYLGQKGKTPTATPVEESKPAMQSASVHKQGAPTLPTAASPVKRQTETNRNRNLETALVPDKNQAMRASPKKMSEQISSVHKQKKNKEKKPIPKSGDTEPLRNLSGWESNPFL
jgi:serine/threonine protein kinase